MCFNALIREAHVESKTVSPNDWDDLEHNTTIALRDTLGDELLSDPGKLPGVPRGLKSLAGIIGKKAMSSGQYEEHDHYFKYALLDLMYQFSFRVNNRKACFEEMIGAIQDVLYRSHRSANMIHRKAIDLLNKINKVGRENNTVYGKIEERKSILQWISKHSEEVETTEHSKL
jgi:hypothetical protein